MGVHVHPGTMLGAVTPICNSCGIALCWDISEEDYADRKQFWDDWKCKECKPTTRHKQDTNMPNIDQMVQSKFLKKEDVGDAGDSAIVTIVGVKQMNVAKEDDEPEMKWVMGFREFPKKPMVLNGTNLKLASLCFGSKDTDDWTGKTIELYHDPSITFGDKLVGGLRFRKQGGKVRPAAADADGIDPNDPPFK